MSFGSMLTGDLQALGPHHRSGEERGRTSIEAGEIRGRRRASTNVPEQRQNCVPWQVADRGEQASSAALWLFVCFEHRRAPRIWAATGRFAPATTDRPRENHPDEASLLRAPSAVCPRAVGDAAGSLGARAFGARKSPPL